MALIRLDVTSREFQGGRSFGEIGPYAELNGEAEFAVDPRHPLNSVITDLDLAGRDSDGQVRFSADVRILRPVGPGNGGILLDVVNRGQPVWARMTEPGPLADIPVTSGWLLQRGYTIVSCGWQHDVPRGQFGLSAPTVPVTGRVTTTKQIDAPTKLLPSFEAVSTTLAYTPADRNERSAMLAVRDDPHGTSQIISRERWRFVDPYHIECDDGFQLGNIYDLTFTAVGAPVTGIGFLAIRDIAAHLKQDGHEFALAFGGSQTARFLRQLLALGCCEDERGQLAIDGLLAIAGGARITEANSRFGQPSAQGPTSATFPYTDALQTDPITGVTDGLLRRALERGKVPKVIYLNTSSEYWSSAAIDHISAALCHLTADGTADVEIPDNLRIYHCAGTQHAPAPLPLGAHPATVHPPNTIDYKPFVRTALDNLAAWVLRGTPPPPSTYPRFDDGTLRREVLVPTEDADGNEVDGIRHPEVQVPLAAYTGWNPRHPSIGGAHRFARSTGATIPFSAEAIAARYSGQDAYLRRVRSAAGDLAAQRYVGAEEVEALVEAAGQRWDLFLRRTEDI